MVKTKRDTPLRKSRNEEEEKRRAEINNGITKLKSIIPYLQNTTSLPGQPEDTKNDTLRLATNFLHVAKSEKFVDYMTNKDPSSEKLFEYFNQVRSQINCSFFFADGDGKIIFTHGDVFEQFGYSAKNVIGRKLHLLLDLPEDLVKFSSKLFAVKQELLRNKMKSKYFKLCCSIKHNTKNTSPLQRSPVSISGKLVLSKSSFIERCVTVTRKKNGHFVCQKLSKPENRDPFLLFGQIEVLSDKIIRHSSFTKEINEYVLYMDPAGYILGADHRMVAVIGYFPQDVKNQFAHSFIYADDLRISFYRQYILLQRKEKVVETVHRLTSLAGNTVWVKSFGVIEEENGQSPTFKLHAVKIDEREGNELRKKEESLLPEEFRKCSIESIVEKIKQLSSNLLPNQSDIQSAHNYNVQSHPIETDIDFEVNSDNSISQSPMNELSSPQSSSPTLSSPSSIQPKLLINSPCYYNHQNGSLNHDQIIIKYIPEAPVAPDNQTVFIPIIPNQQQIFNIQSLVSSTNPQIINSNHVFIQNININNYILTKNNQQNSNGDHFLPTEGEGAFVNLIPFLENESDRNDHNISK
ncbi:uncharacterized protein LOC128388030 [Panonychus citri]|uniref:uncharacterized protein LOC128388030 n=1 Tax=Panonychus citri TaxID=50023 RepID=UPI002307F831|nr:uncharacterized protein LOC128388030 [Panonychus citri]XP_053203348.1 uncharacterized protein LOC128388030 [Panonychus citri]XP_053203349.1 uncharacterized protein LOC128388030 [Panonychus citri]